MIKFAAHVGYDFLIVFSCKKFLSSELKRLAEDQSLKNHDSIVLFFMAHGQQGN